MFKTKIPDFLPILQKIKLIIYKPGTRAKEKRYPREKSVLTVGKYYILLGFLFNFLSLSLSLSLSSVQNTNIIIRDYTCEKK